MEIEIKNIEINSALPKKTGVICSNIMKRDLSGIAYPAKELLKKIKGQRFEIEETSPQSGYVKVLVNDEKLPFIMLPKSYVIG